MGLTYDQSVIQAVAILIGLIFLSMALIMIVFLLG